MTRFMTKSRRDIRGSIIGWGSALLATVVLQVLIFPSVQDATAEFEKLLDSYPDALRAMFAIQSDFTTGAGYLDAELFSFVLPVLLLGMAIGHGARGTAAEEQHHTMDLLLANPISRTRVVLSKALMALVGLTGVGVLLLVALLAGANLVDLEISAADLVMALAAAVLLAATFGALALAVAWTGHRGLATGTAVVGFRRRDIHL